MNSIKRYKKHITKEEISELEIGKFDGHIHIVDTPSDLERACDYLSKCTVIGIDTETKPTFKKGVINRVALLQMSSDDQAFIIRLKKVPISDQLLKIFKSQDIIKVGIAIKDDLKDLKKLRPFEEKNVVDLNLMAPNLGFESIGAKKLTALVLGFRISKRQQVSNWELEELSQSQLDYAATDAWICREIYLKLIE